MAGTLTTQEQTIESPSSTLASGQEVSQHQCHSMKRVPWYAAILCRSGIHWGKWEYLTEGKCGQLKVCQRCSKTRARTKHQWEWRYVKNDACEQVKTCLRCGEKGRQRIEHVWGPTYSVGSDSAHDCTRCKKHEEWPTYGDD